MLVFLTACVRVLHQHMKPQHDRGSEVVPLVREGSSDPELETMLFFTNML
jgi:hypothetical protein